MDKELHEALLSIAKTLTMLTTKILELEENQRKIDIYEIYTDKKIRETFKEDK